MAHLGGRLQLSVPDPLYDVEGRPYHTTDCSRQPQTPLHWPAPLDLSCSAGQEHFNRVPLHPSFEDTKILAPSSSAMMKSSLLLRCTFTHGRRLPLCPFNPKASNSPLISLARSHHPFDLGTRPAAESPPVNAAISASHSRAVHLAIESPGELPRLCLLALAPILGRHHFTARTADCTCSELSSY